MRTLLPAPVPLLAALLTGLPSCSPDQGFSKVEDYGGVYESSISGRVCDTTRSVWLEGATVYTHIVTPDGELVGTVESLTDADGFFHLAELRGDTTYTVYVQYGSSVIDQYDVTIEDTQNVELPEPECSTSLSSAVAVISGDYDELAAVLSRFGVGDAYQVNGQTGTDIVEFLQNADNLLQYQAILFAGGHIEEDVFYDTDGSDVDGNVARVQTALRSYVEAGGTLWATDWSYDVVEQVWPSKVDFLGEDTTPNAAQLGEPTRIEAAIDDTDLQNSLGAAHVSVDFELDTWPVATEVGEGVTVYQHGDAPYRFGLDADTARAAPLAVSFAAGDGRVIYTSWTLSANAEHGEGVIRYLLGGL